MATHKRRLPMALVMAVALLVSMLAGPALAKPPPKAPEKHCDDHQTEQKVEDWQSGDTVTFEQDGVVFVVEVTIDGKDVSFELISPETGWTLDSVEFCLKGGTGDPTMGDDTTGSHTQDISYVVVYDITVSRTPPDDPDEVGDEGCTPGFWRGDTPANAGSWAASEYAKTDIVPGTTSTFEDALTAQGGGMNALLRHYAAALLNADNSIVGYPYTTAELIQMFDDAVADGGDAIEDLKDLLDEANNLGCPLGRNSDYSSDD